MKIRDDPCIVNGLGYVLVTNLYDHWNDDAVCSRFSVNAIIFLCRTRTNSKIRQVYESNWQF